MLTTTTHGSRYGKEDIGRKWSRELYTNKVGEIKKILNCITAILLFVIKILFSLFKETVKFKFITNFSVNTVFRALQKEDFISWVTIASAITYLVLQYSSKKYEELIHFN